MNCFSLGVILECGSRMSVYSFQVQHLTSSPPLKIFVSSLKHSGIGIDLVSVLGGLEYNTGCTACLTCVLTMQLCKALQMYVFFRILKTARRHKTNQWLWPSAAGPRLSG